MQVGRNQSLMVKGDALWQRNVVDLEESLYALQPRIQHMYRNRLGVSTGHLRTLKAISLSEDIRRKYLEDI